jgi:colanic acid/amylovoran biosynthesis glycosyltransferase
VLRALPVAARSALTAPRLTAEALSPARWGYQAESLSALYRLASLARSRGPFDVAHAHFGPVGLAFRVAKPLWRVPLVVTFHGYDFERFPREHGADVYAALFATADAVTVNSRYTRERLVALGCPERLLHLVPMGIDVQAFRPPEGGRPDRGGDIRVVTVARLVEKKGIAFALRAFAQLRSTHPGARFDVAGDGPLRSSLEALAADLGVSDAVTFHGAVGRDAVRDLLGEADVFVLASVTAADGDQEGQGVVLAEAQASGLPVVATEHGGLPDSLRPGESGLLVPERHAGALAAALLALAGDPDLRRRFGARGREFAVERFDRRRLDRELAALFDEVRGALIA